MNDYDTFVNNVSYTNILKDEELYQLCVNSRKVFQCWVYRTRQYIFCINGKSNREIRLKFLGIIFCLYKNRKISHENHVNRIATTT